MGMFGAPCAETQQPKKKKAARKQATQTTAQAKQSGALSYEPLVTVSLAKQIADQIRGSIMDGSLQADDRLPTEQELAKQFQVSRPTIREALKRLAAQNLVRSRRGPAGGTFVNPPSSEELSAVLTAATARLVGMGTFDIAETLDARHELEVLCARLAAKKRSDSELAIMAEEIERQRDASISDIDFARSDLRFHRALADAAHNPLIRVVMFSVIEALQSVEKIAVLRYQQRKHILGQHERILAGLKAKDSEVVVAAVNDQAEHLRERFNVALGWKYVQRLVERDEAKGTANAAPDQADQAHSDGAAVRS